VVVVEVVVGDGVAILKVGWKRDDGWLRQGQTEEGNEDNGELPLLLTTVTWRASGCLEMVASHKEKEEQLRHLLSPRFPQENLP